MKVTRPINRHELQELRDSIRKVFVEIWDPLRLMDALEWPRDEYDRYIDGVVSLLIRGGKDQQIMDHLVWATECMGMDGSSASLQTVAAAIRAIDRPGRPSSAIKP
jgi:hypothetical protein